MTLKLNVQEVFQKLDTRAVLTLIVGAVIASCFLVISTIFLLANAGHGWLALLIMCPLGQGFAHFVVKFVRYCRPQWFKPTVTQ